METAGSKNHNVHYVKRLGRRIDYVILCTWFEHLVISNSAWVGRGWLNVRGLIPSFMGWLVGQALRIIRMT